MTAYERLEAAIGQALLCGLTREQILAIARGHGSTT